MYEKYNAEEPGHGGGGGEYIPQVGFGWTNGAALDLLNIYGETFTTLDPPSLFTQNHEDQKPRL